MNIVKTGTRRSGVINMLSTSLGEYINAYGLCFMTFEGESWPTMFARVDVPAESLRRTVQFHVSGGQTWRSMQRCLLSKALSSELIVIPPPHSTGSFILFRKVFFNIVHDWDGQCLICFHACSVLEVNASLQTWFLKKSLWYRPWIWCC